MGVMTMELGRKPTIGELEQLLDAQPDAVRILPSGQVILMPQKPPGFPEVVCLCGSSRFVAQMAVIGWTLERDEGKIVLGLHLLPESYGPQRDHQAEAEGVAEKMDELHMRKIDLANRVLVVNIGGYIGWSTRNEINYAEKVGTPITYLEEVKPLTDSESCETNGG